MGLAFDLLLTLLIELPIIALFFKQKKRPLALKYGLLVNLISWPLAHILKISTEIDMNIIEIGVVIGEGIGLWLLMGCGWKKGLIISIIANGVSFLAIRLINFDADTFEKSNMIVH